MSRTSHPACAICSRPLTPADRVDANAIRPAVAERIRHDHPDWDGAPICRTDFNHYRVAYLESMLDAERGELTALDRDVLEHIRAGELVSRNVDAALERNLSRGDQLADRIAEFGGSWSFILTFFAILVGWMALNTIVLVRRPFDPYPFILLNLVLSCIAAVQAPLIMMSQRRQEMKDRARSEHDYEVNLKAELEVRLLHEKLDHLILHQWQRLLDIQEMQVEMLGELGDRPRGRH